MKVTIARSGGYDPRLPAGHPRNCDPRNCDDTLPPHNSHGALPTPLLTATILSGRGSELGAVVVHGEPGWVRRSQPRPRATTQRRECHCSRCGVVGHSARNPKCPGRAGGWGRR